MTEKWFPQRKTIDAPIALLKTFIYHVEHPISKFTIERDIKNHPEFPTLSFKAIAELLEQWGMSPVVYKLSLDKLPEIPVPSISFIHETFRGLKLGSLILFFGSDGKEVCYNHARKGWVYEPILDFEKKWSSAMISLTGIEGKGEPDFAELENLYEKKLLEHPDRKILTRVTNFLTPEQCDYIIQLSEDKFKRSLVNNETPIVEGRTSYTANLPFNDDPVLAQIRQKASELLDLPESHFEYFQCVSYEAGQEYQNHFDTFDPKTKEGQESLSDGGQRKYTLLVYLNDDFEGGQTYFPKLDALCDPVKGDAVLFNNIDADGKVIDASWHAGLPVSIGRKYALNIWVRENPIREFINLPV